MNQYNWLANKYTYHKIAGNRQHHGFQNTLNIKGHFTFCGSACLETDPRLSPGASSSHLNEHQLM